MIARLLRATAAALVASLAGLSVLGTLAVVLSALAVILAALALLVALPVHVAELVRLRADAAAEVAALLALTIVLHLLRQGRHLLALPIARVF